MAHYKLVVNIYLRRKIDEGPQHLLSGKDLDKDDGTVEGSQHLEMGEKVKYACFKCDRFKPECYGARIHNFDRKVDGTLLNTQDVIDKKISYIKVAKKHRAKK